MSYASSTTPIIFGCEGTTLSDGERAFFRDALPVGFILFQKNCESADQLKQLTHDLRACVGWEAPILIDQEGGRVQRLKPPVWPAFPAMRRFGDLYKTAPQKALDALRDDHIALAAAQCPLGIDVNCVPVLDVVPADNNVRAIDDRSFGADPDAVAALGLAAVQACLDAGVTPVMKHMPGHGRARADSHYELPRVDATRADLEQDFAPFRAVAAGVDNAHLWGMSAHIIFSAIDPELPGTLSPTITNNIIRNEIGFDGLLYSDDLFMDALAPFGDVPTRAKLCLEAGLDIALHCHGDIAARAKTMESLPAMRPESARRLKDWLEKRPAYKPCKSLENLLLSVQAALAG